MRVTIERTAFLKALNHVQSVVERRNTIPILSNVLIQAAGANLRLTATDLDIEIVETVVAEVGREGAATVPAHIPVTRPDTRAVNTTTTSTRSTMPDGNQRFSVVCAATATPVARSTHHQVFTRV